MAVVVSTIHFWCMSVVLTVLFSLQPPEPDTVRSSGKIPEEAIVDEEAILSLLESSQTFLPPSQTSSHSPLLGILAALSHPKPHSAHYSNPFFCEQIKM